MNGPWYRNMCYCVEGTYGHLPIHTFFSESQHRAYGVNLRARCQSLKAQHAFSRFRGKTHYEFQLKKTGNLNFPPPNKSPFPFYFDFSTPTSHSFIPLGMNHFRRAARRYTNCSVNYWSHRSPQHNKHLKPSSAVSCTRLFCDLFRIGSCNSIHAC